MIRKVVLHPILLAVYPVLKLYAEYFGYVDADTILLPLITLLGSAVLFWLALNWGFKNRQKSGLLVSVFLLAFFSHRGSYVLLDQAGIRPDPERFTWIDLAALLGVTSVITLAVVLVRRRKDTGRWNAFMNLLGISVVILTLLSISLDARRLSNAMRTVPEYREVAVATKAVPSTHHKPDIYFLVFDAYARADVLRDVYGYDNFELLSFLRRKGFFVADFSRSNYISTPLSLASTLNFDFLQNLLGGEISTLADWWPARNLVRQNRVTRFLQERQYSIVAFSTPYYNVDLGKADIYLSEWWFLNDFDLGIVGMTPVPWLLRKLGLPILHELHRARILDIRRRMPEVVGLPGPKFVYAHIQSPHPPFVFGPHGEPVNPKRVYGWKDPPRQEYIDGYRGQVQFVDRMMRDVIADILETSASAPIIVIQSDHGPAVGPWVAEPTNESLLIKRFGILNALYLPDGGQSAFYKSISSVNTFRAIFNHYFDTNYEFLPDRSFFSTIEKPYEFVSIDPAE